MHDQDIKISVMDRKNLDEILSIETDSFVEPWSRNMFLQELDLEISRNIVASRIKDNHQEIVGYMIYWMVSDEVHLQKIATKKAYRRRGISSNLLRNMLENAMERECSRCLLEVRRSNEQAIRLYEKFGFTMMGIRPSYYTRTPEDAVLMEANLQESIKLISHES
jgi:ribosomal-protein-alanine N-acetyltransferase